MSYRLEQARRDYPALDAHERGDHAALLAAHPVVDQIRAAQEPWAAGKPQRALSPSAREYPQISDGLDRAHSVALDLRPYAPDDVKMGSFLRRRMRSMSANDELGGVVVVHCRELSLDREGGIPASLAYRVPGGWSYEEFARAIARDTWACWLCERGQNYNCESFLLVSCGAVIHVLSSCRRCRSELDYKGLDWADQFPRSGAK